MENPDFIPGHDAVGILTSSNKMKFNDDIYSWSSDAKGWFKDTKDENDIAFYLHGDYTIGRLREIIAEHIKKESRK